MTTVGAPDFVVVGHVCQDIQPDGQLSLGGSVSYAATTAQRMGRRVGIVTSAGPSLDAPAAFPGMEVVCHEAAETTVFENIYLGNRRKQILHQRASVLTCEHVPHAWRSAPIAYLGSIDREIDSSVFHCFDEGVLVGVMPQGFFRDWDDKGQVFFANWQPTVDILTRTDVLVISELDVPDPEALVGEWGRHTDLLVITRADRGATVYQRGEACHYPARSARQIDPTGAGDVFTAAFLIRYAETRDACCAVAFANAVASFSIEGPGIGGIPWRRDVDAYLDRHGAKLAQAR